VLHLGEHNITGGIGNLTNEAYEEAARQITEASQRGDFAENLQALYRHFPRGRLQRKNALPRRTAQDFGLILESCLNRAEAAYRHIYESDAPLMYFVNSLNMPLPNHFRIAADVVLNIDLRRAFEKNNLDEERIRTLLDEAERLKIPLDGPALEFSLRRTIERLARYLAENPATLPLLENLNTAVMLARSMPFPVDLWEPSMCFMTSHAICIRACERRWSGEMPRQRPGPPGSAFSARICPSGWIRWLRLAFHSMWVEPQWKVVSPLRTPRRATGGG
jgi:hypothetical protein